MKNIIAEMKNSLEGINSRSEQAEERISKLKGRKIKIIQSEEKEKKNEEK